MSAAVPSALRTLAPTRARDVLVCARARLPRDAIDRLHVGEPHQLDLWRVTERAMTALDLEAMIAAVVDALLPGAQWRALPASHPYTEAAARSRSCRRRVGRAARVRPRASPRARRRRAGRALGAGHGHRLDRAVMLRKGIGRHPPAALRRSRVVAQMRDLEAYREVSAQPAARRDMSIACAPGLADEDLGDRVRGALSAEQAEWVEEVAVAARTPVGELPPAARERIGIADDQENLLVRVVLRHPTRSLAKAEANALRDRIYAALHEGSRSGPRGPKSDPAGGDRLATRGARAASRPSRRRSGSR
jgi:phenylalanyl-tRNA synthetase alpha chain